jgi:gamma-glutamyl-gamma-aminobutyrate hydrolase PuuD
VTEAGGLPLPLPPEIRLVEEFLDNVEGLVLTGGFDVNPERYKAKAHPQNTFTDPRAEEFEFTLYRQAKSRKIPVLAICRGMQLVNVARGGTLIQHLPDVAGLLEVHREKISPPRHEVVCQGNSVLQELLGRKIFVNSFHHQAVARVGKGLTVIARSKDGVIEALADGERPDDFLGVQWHPESRPFSQRPDGLALFQWLIERARKKLVS